MFDFTETQTALPDDQGFFGTIMNDEGLFDGQVVWSDDHGWTYEGMTRSPIDQIHMQDASSSRNEHADSRSVVFLSLLQSHDIPTGSPGRTAQYRSSSWPACSRHVYLSDPSRSSPARLSSSSDASCGQRPGSERAYSGLPLQCYGTAHDAGRQFGYAIRPAAATASAPIPGLEASKSSSAEAAARHHQTWLIARNSFTSSLDGNNAGGQGGVTYRGGDNGAAGKEA